MMFYTDIVWCSNYYIHVSVFSHDMHAQSSKLIKLPAVRNPKYAGGLHCANDACKRSV